MTRMTQARQARQVTGYSATAELPSYRVVVVRYGRTFRRVTKSKPVFVSDGATRPAL